MDEQLTRPMQTTRQTRPTRPHSAGYLLDQAAIGQAFLRMGHRRERSFRRSEDRPVAPCVRDAARSTD